MREGAVQGRLSATLHPSMTIVDRESAFGFEGSGGGTDIRELVIAALSLAIDDALDAELEHTSWSHTRKTDPGGELDCLALDERGRLLTIEVKPAAPRGTGAWAPAQALVYARLFQLLIRREGDGARRTLQEMINQRARLGLSQAATVPHDIAVVPVVAFGVPAPEEKREYESLVEHASTVARALARGNPSAPAVEWLSG